MALNTPGWNQMPLGTLGRFVDVALQLLLGDYQVGMGFERRVQCQRGQGDICSCLLRSYN